MSFSNGFISVRVVDTEDILRVLKEEGIRARASQIYGDVEVDIRDRVEMRQWMYGNGWGDELEEMYPQLFSL